MLLAEPLCWRICSLFWWFSQCIKSVTNILNRSPTSQTGHQHNWSPTSVTDIDVTERMDRMIWCIWNVKYIIYISYIKLNELNLKVKRLFSLCQKYDFLRIIHSSCTLYSLPSLWMIYEGSYKYSFFVTHSVCVIQVEVQDWVIGDEKQ